jgi:hypothetical protein
MQDGITAAEYIRYCNECLDMARVTKSSSQQTMLLHIAETWLRLAESVQEKPTLH